MRSSSFRASITLLAAVALSATAWIALRSIGPDDEPGGIGYDLPASIPETGEGRPESAPARPGTDATLIAPPAEDHSIDHPMQDGGKENTGPAARTSIALSLPHSLGAGTRATVVLVGEFAPGLSRLIMTSEYDRLPGSISVESSKVKGAIRLSVLVKDGSGTVLTGTLAPGEDGFSEAEEMELTRSGVASGIVNAPTRPAARARVFLWRPTAIGNDRRWLLEAGCDDSGAFAIENVSDGPWSAFATHPDLGSSAVTPFQAQGGAQGLQFVLRKESGLFGNLYEESGGPVPEMALWFEGKGSGARFRTVTSADGGFRVLCPDDEYSIWPECPRRESPEWSASSGERMIELKLPRRLPLRVNVTDKATGMQLCAFGLTLDVEGDRGVFTRLISHEPRPMGCHTRLLMLLPGRYSVVVTAAGHAPRSSGALELREGQAGETVFEAALTAR